MNKQGMLNPKLSVSLIHSLSFAQLRSMYKVPSKNSSQSWFIFPLILFKVGYRLLILNFIKPDTDYLPD